MGFDLKECARVSRAQVSYWLTDEAAQGNYDRASEARSFFLAIDPVAWLARGELLARKCPSTYQETNSVPFLAQVQKEPSKKCFLSA